VGAPPAAHDRGQDPAEEIDSVARFRGRPKHCVDAEARAHGLNRVRRHRWREIRLIRDERADGGLHRMAEDEVVPVENGREGRAVGDVKNDEHRIRVAKVDRDERPEALLPGGVEDVERGFDSK
jgi:hypothetical protein